MPRICYRFSVLVVLFCLLAVYLPAQADWSTAQGNFQRTGHSSQEIDQFRLTQAWSYLHPTHGGAYWSDPVYLNERVFAVFNSFSGAPDDSNRLEAFDLNTGLPLWSVGLPSVLDAARGTPSVATVDTTGLGDLADLVYVSTGQPGLGSIRCYRASDGSQKWSAAAGGRTRYSRPVLVDTTTPNDGSPDLVAWGNENGDVRAVNAVTGAFVWNTTPDLLYWIFFGPSLSADDSIIYVGNWDITGTGHGKVHALDSRTGVILGTFDPLLDGAYEDESYPGGVIYINDSNVVAVGYGVDGVTGRVNVLDRLCNLINQGLVNMTATFSHSAIYPDPVSGDTLIVSPTEGALAAFAVNISVRARDIPTIRTTGGGGFRYNFFGSGLPESPVVISNSPDGVGFASTSTDANDLFMFPATSGSTTNPGFWSKHFDFTDLFPGFNLQGSAIVDSADNDSGIVFVAAENYGALHAFRHNLLPRARWVNTASELLLNSPTELAGTDTDTALFVNIGDGPGLYSVATDSVLVAVFKNPEQITRLAVSYRHTSSSRENLAFGLADDMSVTARNKFFNKSVAPSQKVLLLDQVPNLPNRVAYQTKDKSNPTSAAAPPAWLTINDLTAGGPILAGDPASIEATGDASGLNFGIYYAEILMTVTPTEPDPDLYGGTDIVLPVRFVIGFIPEEVVISTPVIDQLVTNFAAVGDDAGSVSFAYNGINQLFDGSIILGSTDSTLAMDVYAHSLAGIAPDSVITVTDFTGDSTHTGTAFLATVGSQVRVVQTTRSYNDPERAGFIIYRLEVTNVTDTLIPNLAVGLFLDWDVGDFSTNLGGMDTTYKIFYMYDNPAPEFKCGIMSLPFTQSVHGFNVLDNNVYVYPTSDVVDDSIWNIMSAGGFSTTGAGAPDDHSHLLTLSYADLDSGETRVEEFAFFGYDTTLVTTDSLANLINGMSTGVRPIANPPAALPKTFELGQNFPNPFNAITQIRFNVPAASQVSLDVYDILGRKVRTLVNDYLTAGVKQILWDGRNQSGDKVASGIYFYRMTAGDYNQIKKMVLLK